MNFRQDIQGLRALAVLLVIIFHINESILPGGFIGVDMFFVISGYLISKSIITSIDRRKFSLMNFFEGRVRRIVPAYYFMLLLCIIVTSIIFIPSDFDTFFHQLKRTFSFLSNQLFAVTDNYFGAKSFENPLLHTWSLSVEMQFYLFLPIFLILMPKKWWKITFALVFFAILFYIEYNIRIADQKAQMYFSLLARSIEFIVGMILNIFPKRKFRNSIINESMAFLALAIIVGSCFLIDSKSLFPGLLALPACFATAIIIWTEDTLVNKTLAQQIPNYIGKISYSLYLWHWPVLSLYRYKTMEYHIDFIPLLGNILCFVSLSIISFYLIENRFTQYKRRKFYGVFGIFTIIMLVTWFYSKELNQKNIDLPQTYISPTAFNNNNHNKYSGYELIGDSDKADDRILIIGDSHGLGMLPFMEFIGQKYHYNFSAITMNHYPPIPGLQLDHLTNEIDKEAYIKLSAITDKQILGSKIIILIKYWPGPADFKLAYNYLYKKMTSDQSLIILSDIPHIGKNPVREYKSLLKPDEFKSQIISKPNFDEEVLAFAKNKENVHFLDLFDKKFFADAPYYNDTLMYIDESHINLYGSKEYANKQGHKVITLINTLTNNK